jgi:peptide/nickel transport system permease protein
MTAPLPSPETLHPTEPSAVGSERASAHTWRAFRRDPLGMISLGLLASYGPDVLRPPGAEHWFGTDALGRDVFSEVIWGTQQSVLVAVAASVIAIIFGTIIAVIGAYFRRLDGFISVIVDMTLSLPVLPLMILIAALVGPSTSRGRRSPAWCVRRLSRWSACRMSMPRDS